MIFETKDDFESLLNDYLPSKDNSKSENQRIINFMEFLRQTEREKKKNI